VGRGPAVGKHYANLVCPDQAVTELGTVKFLGLRLDNRLTWKPYIGFIFCTRGAACIVIRLSNILSIDTLKAAYYSYFAY
jgi:hypothetical protein